MFNYEENHILESSERKIVAMSRAIIWKIKKKKKKIKKTKKKKKHNSIIMFGYIDWKMLSSNWIKQKLNCGVKNKKTYIAVFINW